MEEEGKVLCPVCGAYTFEEFGDYDICDVCYWENDPVQYRDPDYRGGANKESLNEARAAWKAKQDAKKGTKAA